MRIRARARMWKEIRIQSGRPQSPYSYSATEGPEHKGYQRSAVRIRPPPGVHLKEINPRWPQQVHMGNLGLKRYNEKLLLYKMETWYKPIERR